jgi:hypothetical protein
MAARKKTKQERHMKPTPEISKITQLLRCQLSDDEQIQSGKELADATNELTELENEKAQIVSDFKARMTAVEARVAVLGNKLRSGYEFRQVECSVTMDIPEPGQKQTVRLDTKEVVATAAMTEDEKQRKLELDQE